MFINSRIYSKTNIKFQLQCNFIPKVAQDIFKTSDLSYLKHHTCLKQHWYKGDIYR